MAHDVTDGEIEVVIILSPSSYWVRCSNCFKPESIHHFLDRYLSKNYKDLRDSFQPQLGDVVSVLGIDDFLSRGKITRIDQRNGESDLYTVYRLDYLEEITVTSNFIYPCELKWQDLEPQVHLIGLFGIVPCKISYDSPIDIKEALKKVADFEGNKEFVEEAFSESEAAIFHPNFKIDSVLYGWIHLKYHNKTVVLNEVLPAKDIGFKSESFDDDLIVLRYIQHARQSKKEEVKKAVNTVQGNPVEPLCQTKLTEKQSTIPSSFQEISESVALVLLEPFEAYMKRLAIHGKQIGQKPTINPQDKITIEFQRLDIEDLTPIDNETLLETQQPRKPLISRKIRIDKCPNSEAFKEKLDAQRSIFVLNDSDFDAFLDSVTESSIGDMELPGEELITFRVRGKDILKSRELSPSSGDDSSDESNVADELTSPTSRGMGRGEFSSREKSSIDNDRSVATGESSYTCRRGGLGGSHRLSGYDDKSSSFETSDALAHSTLVEEVSGSEPSNVSPLSKSSLFRKYGLRGALRNVGERSVSSSNSKLDERLLPEEFDNSFNSPDSTQNFGFELADSTSSDASEVKVRRPYAKRGGISPRIPRESSGVEKKTLEKPFEPTTSRSSPVSSHYDVSNSSVNQNVRSDNSFSNVEPVQSSSNETSLSIGDVSQEKHRRPYGKRGGLMFKSQRSSSGVVENEPEQAPTHVSSTLSPTELEGESLNIGVPTLKTEESSLRGIPRASYGKRGRLTRHLNRSGVERSFEIEKSPQPSPDASVATHSRSLPSVSGSSESLSSTPSGFLTTPTHEKHLRKDLKSSFKDVEVRPKETPADSLTKPVAELNIDSCDSSSHQDVSNSNEDQTLPRQDQSLQNGVKEKVTHRSYAKRGRLSRLMNRSDEYGLMNDETSSQPSITDSDKARLDDSAPYSRSLSSTYGSFESLSSNPSDSRKVIEDIAKKVEVRPKERPSSRSLQTSLDENATPGQLEDVSAKSENVSLSELVSRIKSRSCLVHGNVTFEAEFNVNKLKLNSSIKETVAKKRISGLLRSQAFSMPIILQRRNLVMVAPARNRRTFSYVVSLLSLLMDPMYYANLKASNAPTCVIIAPNSHRVRYIASMCNTFSDGKLKVVTTHGGGLELERKGELANGCDILISTPKCWLRLLQSALLTDMSRLCHLVLDSGDDMIRLFLPEIKIIFALLKNTIELRRNHPDMTYDIQTIVVADSWTRQLEDVVFSNLQDPVVLFASHLEAAIYGKILPKVRLIKPEMKLQNIMQIVKDCDKSKTVIVCSTLDECNEIFSTVIRFRSNIIRVHEQMPLREMTDKINEWSKQTSDDKLLICTDSALSDLAITDARVLIHTSLPLSKSNFNDRFAVIQDSLPDRIKNPNASRPDCQVIILLSINDGLQFPALVDFMRRIPLKVPDEIINCAEKVKRKKAESCHDSLCPYLLLRGECINESKCRKRHIVDAGKDSSGKLPTRGYIKCKILYVHNPIKFSVKILEYTESAEPSSGPWKSWPSNMKEITSKMEMLFVRNRHKPGIGKAKIGDVVCVEVEFDVKYMRAKIIDILRRDDKLNPMELRVVYLDDGRVENVMYYKLLALPPELASLPGEAVDICQTNLLPVDMDIDWSYISTKAIKDRVRSSMHNDEQYVRVKVSCAVGKTIMVESLGVFATESKIETLMFDLKSFLLSEKMAVKNPEHIVRIKSLCSDAGIAFPEAIKPKITPEKKRILQGDVRWAHFPNDSNLLTEALVTNIRSPSLFFCTNAKFHDMLKSLEKDIGSELDRIKYPLKKPIEGGFCAVQSPSGTEWNRAKINNCLGDRLEIFYADYGDSEVIEKHQAYVLPEKFINRLPFQAIECELAGIQARDLKTRKWSYESLDHFFDMVMVKNGELTQWKTLNLSVCDLRLNAQLTDGRHYKVVLIDPLADPSNSCRVLNEALVFSQHALWNANCNEYLNKWGTTGGEEKDAGNGEDGKVVEPADDEQNAAGQDIIENAIGDFDVYIDPKTSADLKKPQEPQKQKTNPSPTMKPIEAKLPVSQVDEENKNEDVSNVRKLINLGLYMPNVLWRQSAEYIWIKFILTDIEDYGLKWSNDYIRFWTNHKGQDYFMNMDLFGPVHGDTLKSNKTGFYLEIKVMKVVQGKTWPRLTYLPTKSHFIKPDILVGSSDEPDDGRGFIEEKIELGRTKYLRAIGTVNDDDDAFDNASVSTYESIEAQLPQFEQY